MKKTTVLLFVLMTLSAIRAAEFFPVDLRKYATTGFSDSVANDYMGGWFDEGNNDLRNFPSGRRDFAGVVFDIIDPRANSDAACIVLRCSHRPYFPPAVRDIPVNRNRIDYIHFLHTSGWGDDKLFKESIFHYLITYEDGSTASIPVRSGLDIGNWWAPKKLPNAEIAWADYNPAGHLVAVWRMTAANPHPEKKIRSIGIVSDDTTALPGIVGITMQRGGSLPDVSPETMVLPVAVDSKETIRIPAAASAVKKTKKDADAVQREELEQIRRKTAELRILNELYATGVKAENGDATPALPASGTPDEIGIFDFACPAELLHFFKHAGIAKKMLKGQEIPVKTVDLQEFLSGGVTPENTPVLLYFAGDPYPYKSNRDGDGKEALGHYVRDGGAVLFVNALPGGRRLTKTGDAWEMSPTVSYDFPALRTRAALADDLGANGNLYLKGCADGLPAKLYLPAYAARGYRILDEKAVQSAGWRMSPLWDLYREENGTDKRIGCAAALLYDGTDSKGALGWVDPESLKQSQNIWKDSRTKRSTGVDPRAQDHSDAGARLLKFAVDNIRRHGQFERNADTGWDRKFRQAEQEFNAEQDRCRRLTAALKQTERKVPGKKLSVRDGMFCIDGNPKIVWGTEISGYAGQGGNGVTSPLGKHYLSEAAKLFHFDFAALIVRPVLEEYRGMRNPKIAPSEGLAKRDLAADLHAVAAESSRNGWVLGLDATYFSYNSQLLKKAAPDLFPPDSIFSMIACPEKEATWEIAEKLYRWTFDNIAPYGNLGVVELDNESQYISYSAENIVNFRRWLEHRYGTIGKLNGRWNRRYASFEEIQPPALRAKDAVSNGIAPVVDWIKFQQDAYDKAVRRKKAMIETLLAPRKVLYSIQPFATLAGGEHRHSYAMRGCDYERLPELVDILSSERLFTPLRSGQSPEEIPRMIGIAGYLFTDMMRCIADGKLPVLNVEGAMVKYGEKKTAAEYQLAVWSHIIHGDQGVVPDYWCFFPAADSVVDPANNEPDVLKAMAGIGASLEKYGELVAPVPRLRGTIAEYVSFESMRDIRRGFELETEYYAGVFSRRPLDLITGKQILGGKLGRYKALLLTGAHLVDEPVFEAIRNYVRNGGIVLATPETFRGDEYGKAFSDNDFFPLKNSLNLLDEPLSAKGERNVRAQWGDTPLAFLFFDPGISLQAGTVLAKTPDGRPALAVRSFGKGKVYQTGGVPQAAAYLDLWKQILDREKIEPAVQVNGPLSEYFVEAQIVERKNGFLLYLGNFRDKAQTVEIPAGYRLSSGKYRMTSLLDGRPVKTKSGNAVWDGAERAILSLPLPAHGTEVIYFETVP